MNSDPPNANPVVPPLPSSASVSFLGPGLTEALARNDAATCRRIAERASESRQADRIAPLGALCDLLMLPYQRRKRRKRRGAEWEKARAAAATALGRIGEPTTFPQLAQALFDPSFEVRKAAEEALRGVGNAAAEALVKQQHNQLNWSVASMETLIALQGNLQSNMATKALLMVLTGELPANARRWDRIVLAYPFYVLAVPILIGLCCAATVSFANPDNFALWARIWGALEIVVAGLFWVLFPALIFYVLLVLCIGVPVRSVVAISDRNRLSVAAARALQQIGNKRTLPRLLATCRSSHPNKRAATVRAVVSLLPQLEVSDTTWLRPDDRAHISWLLQSQGPDVVITALRALRQVGTVQELPPVRRLAERGAAEVVRAEARETQLVLEERQAQAQASSSLLRASKSPTPAGDTLLRAATSQSETPAEQLLRPLE